MGRIIAVANQKGGVGKTTTAVNVAAALSMAERPVLLVDADPQANCTRSLGYPPDPDRASVYDLLHGEAPGEGSVLPVEDLPYLRLLPSDRNLTGAEVELVDAEGREFRLRRALEPLRSAYEYVLIDCPPSLGLLTVNALAASDSVLVPVQCEFLPLEGMSQLMDTIDRVRVALNSDLRIEGVLLTMFDERTLLSRQVEEEVRSVFGERVFRTVVPRNVRLGEAPSFGKPIFLYDVRSRGAEAYLTLAKEFLDGTKSIGQGAAQPDS